MNKGRKNFISTGISSILLVFVVLCLITFAVLALTSANADYRLSKKVADRTTAYYEAEARANERLEEIDGILAEQYNKSENAQEYEENILAALAENGALHAEKQAEGISVLFSEKIDETQALQAELTAVYPQEAEEGFYRVRKWQSVSAEEWNPDTTLTVMQQGE